MGNTRESARPHLGLPWWLSGKESTCNAGDTCRRHGFDSWVGKILRRRKWQTIPVFLPGKSHGQGSLVGYSPWGGRRVKCDLATRQQQQKTKTPLSQVTLGEAQNGGRRGRGEMEVKVKSLRRV